MESGFNNSVVSSVGAQGVMQLLPSTWDYVEKVADRAPGAARRRRQRRRSGWRTCTTSSARSAATSSLALAGWYQGERAVKASGPYKVSKVFVANVLALRQRM